MMVERCGKGGDRGRGGTEEMLTQRKDGRKEITKSLREKKTHLETFMMSGGKTVDMLTPAWTPNTWSIMSSEKLPDLILLENIVSMLFLRAGRE